MVVETISTPRQLLATYAELYTRCRRHHLAVGGEGLQLEIAMCKRFPMHNL